MLAATAIVGLIPACAAAPSATPAPSSQAAATPQDLRPATLTVPVPLRHDVFDTPHQVLIPAGWTISLWAWCRGPVQARSSA